MTESRPTVTITCPSCHSHFKRTQEKEAAMPLRFCAYCGSSLFSKEETHVISNIDDTTIKEHIPKEHEIKGHIGRYQILKSIGKGGMGEVLLVYDTVCGRRLALKKIRENISHHEQIQRRFLREARLTSQLAHPAIIPIYTIHTTKEQIYYTMPYVAGKTLKQILRSYKKQEQESTKKPQNSIPTLIRHFLQICQAIAFAHSKGVLHRDIKPENIIIGKYGQIVILDWGLAKILEAEEDPLPYEDPPPDRLYKLTRFGKVVGTLSYMAPERVQEKQATVLTDIYSLGVILYQILTLSNPFYRKDLETFKKNWQKERFIPPEVMAPYREVPQVLSEVVKRCLSPNPEDRYQTVDQLIKSIENYIEGRSEWFAVQELSIANKSHWLFQENVLFAEYTAITHAIESSDWLFMMVSKKSFHENIKIEADITIDNEGNGIGFLFSVPGSSEHVPHIQGYCLWLSCEQDGFRKTRLMRSSLTVLEAPEIILKKNTLHKIVIEKVDQHVHFYLDGALQFSYTGYVPVMGTHVGIVAKDADFTLEHFTASVGSQNIMVHCLAVPDALLATKNYETALTEYRRIGQAFPGTQDGREALFRAGMTLLEQAQNSLDPLEKEYFYDMAYKEFENLKNTPGAPLEYLGKAFIYKAVGETDEEVKCFELVLRKYKDHPLLPVIQEQIICRMHESSIKYRLSAYHFIYLAARFLPENARTEAVWKIFTSLQKHWEVPYFIMKENQDSLEAQNKAFCSILAFYLNKPFTLGEIIDELLAFPILPMQHIANALFALLELSMYDLAEEKIKQIKELLSPSEQKRYDAILKPVFSALEVVQGMSSTTYIDIYKKSTEPLNRNRLFHFTLQHKIEKGDFKFCRKLFSCDTHYPEEIDALFALSFLLEEKPDSARKIFEKYPEERLILESSPLYFSYGCFLAKTKGTKEALKLFKEVLDISFPKSQLLGAYALSGKITLHSFWFSQAFSWEKRALYTQLFIFSSCAENDEKASLWKKLMERAYEPPL